MYAFYCVALAILSRGRVAWHYWLGRRCEDLWLWLHPQDLSAVMRNLEVIYRHTLDATVLRCKAKETFYFFSRYWIDFFRSSHMTKADLTQKIVFENLHHIDDALVLGKGVIPVTAHLGNWEMGGVILGLKGYALSAVALSHKNPKVNDLFVRQRESKGVKVIPLGQAARACQDVLKNNGVLALVGDRIFDPAEKSQTVKLFDRDVDMPRGPAYLAWKMGAPLVPTFIVVRDERTFLFRCYPPIYAEHYSSQDARDVITAMTQAYTSRLEEMIREYPTQWFAFQNVWR